MVKIQWKYNQKLLDHAKKSAIDALNTDSNRKTIQKAVGLVTAIVKKFKTTMLKSGLCDYSDVHILIKGTIASQIQHIETRNK